MADITGTSGNDTLAGTTGDDTIDGLEGDDLIDGVLGSDTLRGGSGNDTFRFSAVSVFSGTTPTGLIDGGVNYDTLDLRNISPTTVGTIQVGPSAFTLGAFIGSQKFQLIGIELILMGAGDNLFNHSIGAGSTIEVRTGAGNDTLQSDGNVLLFGEDGDDNFFVSGIIGTATTGALDGGLGVDTLKTNIGFTVDLAAQTGSSFSATYAVRNFEILLANAAAGYTTTFFGDDSANTLGVNPIFEGTGSLIFDGRGGDDTISGSLGNDTLIGGDGNDLIRPGAGNDIVNGGSGNDAFEFGANLTATDRIDGGSGSNDQVGLLGNYAAGLVLNADTITNVEVLAVLPGFSYNITSHDGNVAAGQELSVFGGNLTGGNNFTFNGSADTDGMFRMYGGIGNDIFTGGALSDGFYFGPGKWGASDAVTGGGGTNDQLALDGDYTITIGANADVESLILLAGPVGSQNIFNITLADDWTAAAATKTVWGLNVTRVMSINGSAETNGNLIFFGRQASDTLTGGAGTDAIYGGGAGDSLRGLGGADIFRYDSIADSNGATDATRDRILDFASGADKIDLSRIDAIAGGADDAFTFIGAAAFSNVSGQLRFTDAGGGIFIVEGDVNGDGIADFALSVSTVPPPLVADFVL